MNKTEALELISKIAAGRGRMDGDQAGAGPGGACVCTKCGAAVAHTTAVPCNEQTCAKCGGTMTRGTLDKDAALELLRKTAAPGTQVVSGNVVTATKQPTVPLAPGNQLSADNSGTPDQLFAAAAAPSAGGSSPIADGDNKDPLFAKIVIPKPHRAPGNASAAGALLSKCAAIILTRNANAPRPFAGIAKTASQDEVIAAILKQHRGMDKTAGRVVPNSGGSLYAIGKNTPMLDFVDGWLTKIKSMSMDDYIDSMHSKDAVNGHA